MVVRLNETPVSGRHRPHAVGGVELELGFLEGVVSVVERWRNGVVGEIGKTPGRDVGGRLNDPDDGLGGVGEAELLADGPVGV